MPSMLWHCWLGVRKSIWPVKNWVMRCWHGYLFGARCKWSAYGPADATDTPSSLASVKSRMVTFLVPVYPGCSGKHTHTHTTILRLCGICPGQPGCTSTRRNIHPLTLIMVINHPYLLSPSTAIHDILPIQSTCFRVFFHNLCPVFFGLPLGLAPSTSYSIHFFTQSLSSFHITCPYHRHLFRCSTEIMSSKPSLPLNSLLGTLSCNFTPHIHLTILISALLRPLNACLCVCAFSALTLLVWHQERHLVESHSLDGAMRAGGSSFTH